MPSCGILGCFRCSKQGVQGPKKCQFASKKSQKALLLQGFLGLFLWTLYSGVLLAILEPGIASNTSPEWLALWYIYGNTRKCQPPPWKKYQKMPPGLASNFDTGLACDISDKTEGTSLSAVNFSTVASNIWPKMRNFPNFMIWTKVRFHPGTARTGLVGISQTTS